jgi:hypothetical protein
MLWNVNIENICIGDLCHSCFHVEFHLTPRTTHFKSLLHEHFVKNGCFHWHTSYYKWNFKNALILFKLGTNVDWTVTFVTAYSILNFLLSWLRGHLEIAKHHFLALIFPPKLISKCCNFSMDWDRVKDFSALVTRYLRSPHRQETFGLVRLTTDPLQTTKQRGYNPPLAHPWCIYLIGVSDEKVITFVTPFLKRKQVFWI